VKNILIRCDASHKIGMGHITRCLVLAEEFRTLNYNIYFAMKEYKFGINIATKHNFEVLIASENNFNYNNWIQTIVDEKNINIFIGDIRDGLPIQTIEELKIKNILTVAIDEPSDYRKACDMCFYPPVPQVDDINWNGFNGKIYKGWEYIILKPEFYIDYKKEKNTVPNILVMMGGTDPYNLTLGIIESLLHLKEDVNICVVIKKDHSDYEHIKNINKKVLIYSDINNMAEFLVKIDFGIISFGVTAYELLAMQIPAIHICLDDDHWSSSELFEKENFAKRCKKEKFNFDFKDLSINKRIIKNTQIVGEILDESRSYNE